MGLFNWKRGTSAQIGNVQIADGNILLQNNGDGTANLYVDTASERLQVGGSGGHVIQNPSGTDLAQEPTMQFVDAAVTDDSTNHKTKIENVKEITEAELATAPDGQYIITDATQIPTTSLSVIYPVGSIYLNANNVNPATFLGFGTWSLMSNGYLCNNASAATGGSVTSGSTTLTVNQIPAHTHTATTQTTGAHTHTATTQSAGNHTHTATTGSYGNHTHTATTQNTGGHSHDVKAKRAGTSTWYWLNIPANELATTTHHDWYASNFNYSDSSTTSSLQAATAGSHTHTLTTQNTGAHTHTLTTQNTGAHTHTLTTQSVGDHSHTLTTQSVGGGQGHTHSIEPPYIRVYAFQRTA